MSMNALQELFMSICLLTSLSCNDVTVMYKVLPFDVVGQASMGVSGNYYILISNDVKLKRNANKKELMVHEISHLLVYEIDPTNTSHDNMYIEICQDLSMLVDVNHEVVCLPKIECIGTFCEK